MGKNRVGQPGSDINLPLRRSKKRPLGNARHNKRKVCVFGKGQTNGKGDESRESLSWSYLGSFLKGQPRKRVRYLWGGVFCQRKTLLSRGNLKIRPDSDADRSASRIVEDGELGPFKVGRSGEVHSGVSFLT